MLESTELDNDADRSAALSALHREHYLRLVRLAIQLVDDQPSAEDLVQDVFTRLHRSRHDLSRLDDPARYLTTAVVNQARSALRHRRVVRTHQPSRPHDDMGSMEPADTQVIRDATSALVWKAISRLPSRQKQVVVLRYYEDWSIPEIATALGISRGAASSSLDRALKSLATPIGALNAGH